MIREQKKRLEEQRSKHEQQTWPTVDLTSSDSPATNSTGAASYSGPKKCKQKTGKSPSAAFPRSDPKKQHSSNNTDSNKTVVTPVVTSVVSAMSGVQCTSVNGAMVKPQLVSGTPNQQPMMSVKSTDLPEVSAATSNAPLNGQIVMPTNSAIVDQDKTVIVPQPQQILLLSPQNFGPNGAIPQPQQLLLLSPLTQQSMQIKPPQYPQILPMQSNGNIQLSPAAIPVQQPQQSVENQQNNVAVPQMIVIPPVVAPSVGGNQNLVSQQVFKSTSENNMLNNVIPPTPNHVQSSSLVPSTSMTVQTPINFSMTKAVENGSVTSPQINQSHIPNMNVPVVSRSIASDSLSVTTEANSSQPCKSSPVVTKTAVSISSNSNSGALSSADVSNANASTRNNLVSSSPAVNETVVSSTPGTPQSASTMLTLLSQRVAKSSVVQPSVNPKHNNNGSTSTVNSSGAQRPKYAPIKPKPARTVLAMLQEQRGLLTESKADNNLSSRKRVSDLLQERQNTAQNGASAQPKGQQMTPTTATMTMTSDSNKKRTSQLASLLMGSPNAKAAKMSVINDAVPLPQAADLQERNVPVSQNVPVMQMPQLVKMNIRQLLQHQSPTTASPMSSVSAVLSTNAPPITHISQPESSGPYLQPPQSSFTNSIAPVSDNMTTATSVVTMFPPSQTYHSMNAFKVVNCNNNIVENSKISSDTVDALAKRSAAGLISRGQPININTIYNNHMSKQTDKRINTATNQQLVIGNMVNSHREGISMNEVNITNLEKDALDEYTFSDQSPDLAEINPSISPIVNSSTSIPDNGTSTGLQEMQQQKCVGGSNTSLPNKLQNNSNIIQMLLERSSFNQQTSQNAFLSQPAVRRILPASSACDPGQVKTIPSLAPSSVASGYCMNFYKEAEMTNPGDNSYGSQSVVQPSVQASLYTNAVSPAVSGNITSNASSDHHHIAHVSLSDGSLVRQQYVHSELMQSNVGMLKASSHTPVYNNNDNMKLPLTIGSAAMLGLSNNGNMSTGSPFISLNNAETAVAKDGNLAYGNMRRLSREGTPSCQPIQSPRESPLHMQGQNTPLAASQMMVSPQVARSGVHVQQSPIEPINAFVPIQSSAMYCANTVSPIRPMATLPGQNREELDIARIQQANQNNQQISVMRFAQSNAGFMPYNANFSKNPPSYETAVQLKNLNHHQSNISAAATPMHQFVQPTETVKPIRRQQRQNRKAATRSRHNSASAAIGYNRSLAASQLIGNMGNSSNQVQFQQNNAVNSSQQLPPLLNIQSDFNPVLYQTHLSPEVNSITNMNECTDFQVNHRSHSVPASVLTQSMQGYEPSEDSMDSVDQCTAFNMTNQGFPSRGDVNSTDISVLLQDKIQGGGEMVHSRGTHVQSQDGFGARRNLTEMLESGRAVTNEGALPQLQAAELFSFHNNMSYQPEPGNSRDPLLPNLGCASNTFSGLQQASKLYRRSRSYSGHIVPTPPSSQNASPDFTNEIQNIIAQNPQDDTDLGGTFSQPMPTPDTDTPSSFGSHHDSRDSLTESLLPMVCGNMETN